MTSFIPRRSSSRPIIVFLFGLFLGMIFAIVAIAMSTGIVRAETPSPAFPHASSAEIDVVAFADSSERDLAPGPGWQTIASIGGTSRGRLGHRFLRG